MSKLIVLLSMLFMCGCAPTRWCHDSRAQNFEVDKQECIMQGNYYARSFGYGGNPFIIVMHSQDCLRSKGYYSCSDN